MPKPRGSDCAPDAGVESQRQETLLKTGALQQAIFNSANFSSIATDEKGVIQIFNVGAERMMGYAAIDVVNKVTPADISDSKELIARAAALSLELDTPITPGFEALVFKASRGIEDIYELTYIRKDGSSFPAMVSVTALRDGEDLIIGYLLIGTDNTARQQVEAARVLLDQCLRDQQFYTRSLIESNTDALMMTDPQGVISDVNQQMVSLTGRRRDELIGAPCKNFFTDPQRADAAIRQVLAENRVSNYELTVRAQNGDETVVSYNAATFHDRNDQLKGVFAAARDVTERKRFERSLLEKNVELEHLAHNDPLTGLPNRTLFYKTLKKTLAQAAERGWLVGVVFIDLDHFKNVNDTLGHAYGDDLLEQFSKRLLQCVRIRDTVGRLGGDEFALILVMREGKQGAAVVADKIRAILRAPFDLNGNELAVTASIGITLYPDDAGDPETLIKYADTAMYRAKQAGRDTYRFFTPQMNAEMLARLDLEAALRKAVDHGEFVLHYQPKVHLGSGRISGLEALLRWQRPGHGLVSPRDFIPALEESGLIVRVGSWVIATACRQIGLWLRSPIGAMQVSVNVSGRQFIEGDLDADVIEALAANAIPAALLELELTESSLMANTERTVSSLRNLKRRGVQISIDDFGTGYSSLAYLRRFPIDKLKIDIAFIRDVTSNPDDEAIVLAIIRMAHSLKLDVIAEGVETAVQLAHLRRHGCNQIQGHYFSPPLPSAELEAMLLAQKHLPAADGAGIAPRKVVLLLGDAEARSTPELDGYHVLSARSAAEGLELLALHPVQVLLCRQLAPGSGAAAFLNWVRQMYPDIFVLAGNAAVHAASCAEPAVKSC